MKKIISIFTVGIWITFSEFIRNEYILKSLWARHYKSIGLNFITHPTNGALWIIWSYIMAWFISILVRKFSPIQVIFLTWTSYFVAMWITLYNLQVLPLAILIGAIPLSLFEISIAILIFKFITSRMVGNSD